jgi:hypothetical protein
VDRGSVVADLRLKDVVGVVADPRDQSPNLLKNWVDEHISLLAAPAA